MRRDVQQMLCKIAGKKERCSWGQVGCPAGAGFQSSGHHSVQLQAR